jgi:membrane protease YdiL (CAAX protease family)
MSDVVPPRPDLPAAALPALGISAPGVQDAAAPRPRSSWTWWEAMVVYVGCWFVASLATLPLFLVIPRKGVADVVASAAIAIVNVALLLLWLSRRHPGWARAIGFPTDPLPEIAWGIGFGVLLYPAIAIVVGIVVDLLFRAVTGHAVTTPRQVPSHLPAFGVVATILYAVVIAPIHEELFFRGILFRSIRDRHGFAIGAVASGVLFGAVHYIPAPVADSLMLMTVMVFTGIGLAGLYERRGNIVANMVAHATFNTIGLLFIYLIK